jgi:hypothetical protein
MGPRRLRDADQLDAGIAIQPYRRGANLRELSRKTVAAAASLAVTHPLRKSRLLPHEKTRRSFAFGSPQRYRMKLMLEARLARTTGCKWLTRRRILRVPAQTPPARRRSSA